MRITEIIAEAANRKKQAAIAIAKKKKKGVAEGLNEQTFTGEYDSEDMQDARDQAEFQAKHLLGQSIHGANWDGNVFSLPLDDYDGQHERTTSDGKGKFIAKYTYTKKVLPKVQEQGVAEGSLNEFAIPGGGDGDSGRWYNDDELADIIGDDWFEDFDVSNDGFNIDAYGEKAKKNLVGYANTWFDDKGYNVNVMGVEHNDVDHDLQWYIVGSFHNPRFANEGVAEAGFPGAPDVEMPPMKPSGDPQRDKLKQEYVDLHREIKSLVDLQYNSKSTEEKMQAKARIKQLNDRADQIRAILEPRQPPNEWQKKTYGFDDNWNKVNQGVAEDWNKVNKKDKTSGMSQKAVNAYRRENPGSKLKTAVTTKPSKLKKGSKAANRRKSFCARMGGNKGPMKKPNGKPTPKALALRRWNCESIEELQELVMLAEQFVNKKKNESI